MKKRLIIAMLAITFLAVACTRGRLAEKADVSFRLGQTLFPVVEWKADGSHLKTVKGVLSVDQQVVKNAVIRVGDVKTTTGPKGEFRFVVDQSKFSQKTAEVVNVDHASVGGIKTSSDLKKKLLGEAQAIRVAYPVKILKQTKSGSRITITAQAQTENGHGFPTVKAGKYAIIGAIKDASGKSVQGAVVSTTREQGEGWAKSKPTDQNGSYLIQYLPEDDEESTFRVSAGGKQYTLPNDKVFVFPDETSLRIDAVLPEKGTYIQDRPPNFNGEKNSRRDE
ncbi:carboxypeptidase-like regulatory domain-containing protein [Heyndrickxia coagulans]|uniref:Carboxypeptidase regulatory-like domain-containing protein n=1 Tax=Heyndrickxia coagulans TaxID=1398 RepID=A0AAW7CIN8_HEYCO|nr:carboxypeptidase-like regulatory domain-containing protein [Heyndrickxia coagulans]MDL5042029.1 hypothetical protein [Heyndrickxia coagulans]